MLRAQASSTAVILGGFRNDGLKGTGIAVDVDGTAIVVGDTDSDDFPTENAQQPGRAGGFDVFVTKVSSDGSALVYSTYLGGASTERLLSDTGGGFVAVDASGNAYVTGWTQSSDFPTEVPLQNSLGGSRDAFVTRLDYLRRTFMRMRTFSTRLPGL